MTLTVKLPEDLERDFELHCKLRRLTKSEVVTRLLAQYLALQAPKKTPHQIAREVGLLRGFDGPPDLPGTASGISEQRCVQNILIDAGPVIAWLNRKDSHRSRVKPFLDRWRGNLLTTWPVLAEACAVLPLRLRIPLMLWVERGGVQVFELPGTAAGDLRQLMSKYKDHPMDLADASLVWLAGEIGVADILTVDDDDFAAYRTSTGKPFRNLLPARRR